MREKGGSISGRAGVRYDSANPKQYKNVESIKGETECQPPKNRKSKCGIVVIRAGLDEANIQMQLRKAGAAKWDRKRRLWIARKEVAFNMGLQDRIEVLDVGGEQEA